MSSPTPQQVLEYVIGAVNDASDMVGYERALRDGAFPITAASVKTCAFRPCKDARFVATYILRTHCYRADRSPYSAEDVAALLGRKVRAAHYLLQRANITKTLERKLAYRVACKRLTMAGFDLYCPPE